MSRYVRKDALECCVCDFSFCRGLRTLSDDEAEAMEEIVQATQTGLREPRRKRRCAKNSGYWAERFEEEDVEFRLADESE